MGKLRDQIHNEGFHFKKRPDMLPTEAINRIRVLSERGMGSKAIAKSTEISRNTVRKYLSLFQTLTPISLGVQRSSRLDSFRGQIHEWFLACRGHCSVILSKIQSELGVSISLRMLQKYCQSWRTQELHDKEMTQHYGVPPEDEMQTDFGFDEVLITGIKTRVCVFVAG